MLALVAQRNRPARLKEVPAPHPAPGEILVRVRLVGVCKTDLACARGDIRVPNGRVLGHEAVGTIVQSNGNRRYAEGARVAILPWIHCATCPDCLANRPQRCRAARFLGIDRDGAFGELLAVPVRAVIHIPSSLSWHLAALLEPVNAARAILRPLERITGRVGLLAEGRFLTLLQLVSEDLPETLRLSVWRKEETYDAVVDAVGSARSMSLAVESTRPGGTVILKSRPHAPIPFPVRPVVLKELTIRGANYGAFPASLDWLVRRARRLEPLLGRTYPLAQFQSAFENGDEAVKTFIEIGDHVCVD